MPELQTFIPAIVGIAILVIVAGSIGWLLEHPVLLIAAVCFIGGSLYWLVRRNAARNRV